MRFIIITGLSGAGKTQVIRCLEDLDYYCIDNMPPALIPKFAEICYSSNGKIDKVAMVIDIRGGDMFNELYNELNVLKASGYNYEVLFLEASDEVLVKRYKETRRMHPHSRPQAAASGFRPQGTPTGRPARRCSGAAGHGQRADGSRNPRSTRRTRA